MRRTWASYAQHVARELGLPEPRVARIRLAGILHDIGKVAVPDEILYSDGPLDEEQWRRVKRHPDIGARILGTSELVRHPRLGARQPRAARRRRLPARALRRGDPARVADHPRRGRLRDDDHRSHLPALPRRRSERGRSFAEASGPSSTPRSWMRSSRSSTARPRRPRVCSRTSHFKRRGDRVICGPAACLGLRATPLRRRLRGGDAHPESARAAKRALGAAPDRARGRGQARPRRRRGARARAHRRR